MIVLDTSGLLAAIDSSQRLHQEAARALIGATPPLLLSPFVLAELDYMLGKHVGRRGQDAFLAEVARSAYQLESFAAEDVAEARLVIGKYSDLAIGLADASIAVIAARYGVHDGLTLDERHFRVIEGPGGKPFRLLPAERASGE